MSVYAYALVNTTSLKKCHTEFDCLEPEMLLIDQVRYINILNNMVPRLSWQNCKLFKFRLSLNSQKRFEYKENNTKYRRCPESLGAMLKYWYIDRNLLETCHHLSMSNQTQSEQNLFTCHCVLNNYLICLSFSDSLFFIFLNLKLVWWRLWNVVSFIINCHLLVHYKTFAYKAKISQISVISSAYRFNRNNPNFQEFRNDLSFR